MTTGSTMADKSDGGERRPEHHETFEGFITATKWGVGLVALALILMAVFLV